jgi:oligopeptide/dipeptide ABC transporter ATP-binding protein
MYSKSFSEKVKEEYILSIKNLHVHFRTIQGTVRAVNGVNLSIRKGSAVGVVGESGCGKTLTALSILRLVPGPLGKIVEGKINFKGINLLALPEKEIRKIRGNSISMIFQDPMTSLDPCYSVGNQLAEVFRLHRKELKSREIRDHSVELLKLVEIPMPELRIHQYPHELSGGMRQRVMIASALACKPEILLADEPTTAVDVTIQAQILDLIRRLREESQTSVILITHNLGLMAENVDQVVIMYAGRVVEQGPVDEVIDHYFHPYTKGLFRSIPRMTKNFKEMKQKLHEIRGVVPSLFTLPKGCPFAPRCPRKKGICEREEPKMIEVGANHYVWCWL